MFTVAKPTDTWFATLLSSGNDTINVTAGDLKGDTVIDGGAGEDTLQLNGGGSFDLTVPTTFAGIEIIRGSAAVDTLTLSSDRLAGVATIDGGGGEDVLKLYTDYYIRTSDLRGKTITGFSKIEMADYYGSVLLTDKALALQITGYGNEMTLEGGTFSAEERKVLFDHGIDTVTDTSGTYVAAFPEVVGLDETIRMSIGQTTRLDVGLDATVNDADDATIDSLSLFHTALTADEAITIATTAQVRMSDGMNTGSKIFVGAVGSEVEIGFIDTRTSANFNITFNGNATHARVQELLRSLEYSNMSNDATFMGQRMIDIYLGDKGGRTSTSTVSISVVPDNVILLTTGADNPVGTTGADVFAASNGTFEAGDVINGGDEIDTLQALNGPYGTTFDLTRAAAFSGVEIIKMSDSPSDRVRSDAARLADVITLDGGAGEGDWLELLGTSFNLSDKTIRNLERIELKDRTAAITVDQKDVAALVHGDVYGTASLTLTGGGTFEKAELRVLFENGLKTVTDAAGSHTNAAPVISGLGGDRIATSVGKTVFVDVGGNATVSDDFGAFAALEVSAWNGISSESDLKDRLGIDTSGSITLSNGMNYGSKILLGTTEIGTIGSSGGSHVRVEFKAGTTAEQVQEVLHALTFKNEKPAGTPLGQHQISISLWDTADRATTYTVFVEQEGVAVPSQLGLSASTVKELAEMGTAVGALQIADQSQGETFRFALLDDAGGRFALGADGRSILVANGARLDYEQATLHSIKVRVTDGMGVSFDTSLTIAVQNVEPEYASGTAAADRFIGGFVNDSLRGGAGNDTLVGGGGHDRLFGGSGRDDMTGGAGKDIFVFDSAVARKNNTNVDKITDFRAKDDSIWLENKIFKALGPNGTMKKPVKISSDMFFKGNAAHDESDRIIVSSSGKIYYDADGTGTQAQIHIGTVSKSAVKSMTYADFFVI